MDAEAEMGSNKVESIKDLHIEDPAKKGTLGCYEQCRPLLNAMSEGFALHEIICDESGRPKDFRILDVNPAFERMTGYKKEDLMGRTYNNIVSQEDTFLIERCGAVALTGEPDRFERFSPYFGKHFRTFAYSPAPLQFALLIEDITQRQMPS
jgi:PAS domain S-box-containing protein